MRINRRNRERVLPIQIGRDVGAHDGPNDQAHVGEHAPEKDGPDAVLGIVHILDAPCDDDGGDGREEAGDEAANDDAGERGHGGDEHAEDAVQGGADDIELLAAERFRVGREHDAAEGLSEEISTRMSDDPGRGRG